MTELDLNATTGRCVGIVVVENFRELARPHRAMTLNFLYCEEMISMSESDSMVLMKAYFLPERNYRQEKSINSYLQALV